MNYWQRHANRHNAARLKEIARAKRLAEHICENCGQNGGHWVATPMTLVEILSGETNRGFWTCKPALSAHDPL